MGLNNTDLAWTVVSVGLTSTTTLGINENRRMLILHNTSDTAIDCNLAGAAAVAGAGIRIPAGVAWTFDIVVPKGAIACINTGGSKELRVGEGT